jgi:hypothetical protein
MNIVHRTYTPPRIAAFILGALVFVIYQFGWRDVLAATNQWGTPISPPLAVLCSLVVGYGLAMLGWLVVQTNGQVRKTFRLTRGRVIGAVCMVAIMPLAVLSWFPWIVAGLVGLFFFEDPIMGGVVLIGMTLAVYPLAAMIVRHTYQKRWLRFGLFCLYFWTGYAFHLLWHGEMVFTIRF